jgi:hypothetical protein
MSRFNIEKHEDGWIFQKDGISLIVDGYEVKGDKHWIMNPSHAISYFNIEGHLYGISNQYNSHKTIEDFHDVMKMQYDIFQADKKNLVNIVINQKGNHQQQGQI